MNTVQRQALDCNRPIPMESSFTAFLAFCSLCARSIVSADIRWNAAQFNREWHKLAFRFFCPQTSNHSMSTIKHIRELTARLLNMEEDAPEIDRIIIELANALDTFRYIHEKGPVRLSIVSRQ